MLLGTGLDEEVLSDGLLTGYIEDSLPALTDATAAKAEREETAECLVELLRGYGADEARASRLVLTLAAAD